MNNTKRALEQAVSIDGWIGTFDDKGEATVHADIVFRQGVFGEHKEAPVRFKIALKRAEIVVRCPGDSPLRIIRKSIERTQPRAAAIVNTQTKKERGWSLSGLLSLGKSSNAELTANGNIANTRSTNTELSERVTAILNQHFSTPDGHPAWEVAHSATHSPHLVGAPWDAAEAPRLKVKRNGATFEPTMMLEVRCRREDIEIIDLEFKDPEKQAHLKRKKGYANNLAAAEELIKLELQKAGFLEIPDLSEQHSRLLIADSYIFQDE